MTLQYQCQSNKANMSNYPAIPLATLYRKSYVGAKLKLDMVQT